jgi:acetyl esterase
MPLDPQLQEFTNTVNTMEGPPIETQPVDVQRGGLQALSALALPVEGVDVEERMVMGGAGELHARAYRPSDVPSGDRLPGVVYFHGGGFVIGSLDTHDTFCRAIALGARATVVSVDYRLAPEYPFPGAVEDAVTATASVAELARELGVDDEHLVVAGDSAGGNLALQAAIAARDNDGPRISGLLLLYPWVDLALDRPSCRENAEGYLLQTAQLVAWRGMYAGPDADWSDPALSPVHADLAGLPPTVVVTVEFDPLRDDGVELAARLDEAGVPTEHLALDGSLHAVIHLTAVAESAGVVVDTLVDRFRKLLAR